MRSAAFQLPRARLVLMLASACVLLTSCTGPAPKRAATKAHAAASLAKDAIVESVEPWSYNNREGRIFRTPHYRIFTTQPDTVLNARLPAFLEQALSHYQTALTGIDKALPSPPLKLDTYVLANRTDWSILTRQLTGDQADIYLRIPRGGFAFGGRALLFDIGQRDTFSIAAHEGWHQYTQRTFTEPLPIWLEEGLATYMEGHRFDSRGVPVFQPWFNTERFDTLRRAHASGKTVPLATLLRDSPGNLLAGSDSDAALVYYAQVWALAHFLAEGAEGRFRGPLARLLTDASGGGVSATFTSAHGRAGASRIIAQRRGPVVFEAYFGTLSEAAQAYDVFLTELVRPGSRERIVEGQSPLAAAPSAGR